MSDEASKKNAAALQHIKRDSANNSTIIEEHYIHLTGDASAKELLKLAEGAMKRSRGVD